MSKPLIISVAPNGARKQQTQLPQLPITPEELANEAQLCQKLGSTFLHLHVRDAQHQHSLALDRYRAAIEKIHEATHKNMIVQVTTESCGLYQAEEQMALIQALKPQATSIAIKEFCPSVAYESRFQQFCESMQHSPTHFQYIIYDCKELEYFLDLCQRLIIPPNAPTILLVLGKKPGEAASITTLQTMLSMLPEHIIPFVCAFGAEEHTILVKAAELGCHIRIGFENNHQLLDGSNAPNNAALIEQFIAACHRPIATLQDTKTLLNIASNV